MDFCEIGKSRDDFEFIFKHIPMGIVYLDKNLKILNMNNYYQEKMGVTAEQAKRQILLRTSGGVTRPLIGQSLDTLSRLQGA